MNDTISQNSENQTASSASSPLSCSASALRILQSCGLHCGYYSDIEHAAQGVKEIIQGLRAHLADPPHDIQCLVLKNLGVEGFTEGAEPTLKLVSLQNKEEPHT